jgi:hypothetical protein
MMPGQESSVKLSDSAEQEVDAFIEAQGYLTVIEFTPKGEGSMIFDASKLNSNEYSGLLDELKVWCECVDDRSESESEITLRIRRMKRYDFDNLSEHPGW